MMLLPFVWLAAAGTPTVPDPRVFEATGAAARGDLGALADLERLCTAGDGLACGNLASVLQKGAGGDARRAEVAALEERSCSLGWALGCADLGYMLVRGIGVPADPTRGYQLTEKACSMGYLASCGEAGELLFDGVGVEASHPQALAYFQRACAGDKPGTFAPKYCTKLGAMYESGIATPIDLARAEALLTLACDAGEHPACERIPRVVALRGDRARAWDLAEQYCQRDVAAACAWSGVASLAGKGVPKDVEAASRRLHRGCDLGDRTACYAAGLAFQELGRADNAARHLKKACELGEPAACP